MSVIFAFIVAFAYYYISLYRLLSCHIFAIMPLIRCLFSLSLCHIAIYFYLRHYAMLITRQMLPRQADAASFSLRYFAFRFLRLIFAYAIITIF